MSSTQSPETKLKLLSILAKEKTWIAKRRLAEKAGSRSPRIQSTMEYFERRKFVKSINWEGLTKEERKKFMGNSSLEVPSTTKILYKIDVEGYRKLKSSLQDCFKDEDVLGLLNIPEDYK
jgi:hypothetical protein